jgi:uncharacterized membrane protein
MTMHPPTTTPRINRVLAVVMASGVWLAAGTCALGVIASLARNEPKPGVSIFAGVRSGLDSPEGVLASASRFEPMGFMALGVMILIATPVARVAFALLAFALDRDRLYTAISGVVLTLLACGLVFGVVE